MVPYAKAGNYDAALVGGVKATIMFIEQPQNIQELYAENPSAYEATSWWKTPVSNGWLIAFGSIYLVILVLARPRLKKSSRPEYLKKYDSLNYIIPKTLLLNIALPATWIWTQINYNAPVY
jgi:uncharacterized membrane protein YgcG